jgi:hypothetical protein
MNRNFALPIMAVVLAGVASTGALHAMAQNNTTGSQTLAQKIALKFGLNQSDVQAVFDQNRADHQATMQQRFEDRLTQAVSDGKLTDDQKTEILDKMKELESQRQSDWSQLKDMTPGQRRTAMESKRTDLENWAKDNGIDPQYLMFHMRMDKGMGGGMGEGLAKPF